MEKLTKQNLINFKNNTNNKLEMDVIDYILESWEGYDDKENIFMDVLNHGCQNGIVAKLCYHDDTIEYYDNFKSEINELLYDALLECGAHAPSDIFGDKWDETDPLALDAQNKNLLAWFGFETAMYNIGCHFKEVANLL